MQTRQDLSSYSYTFLALLLFTFSIHMQSNVKWIFLSWSWVDKMATTLNPLTPVPAVTGRAKTHPQFHVPAVTGREEACQDNCLSYPPWRYFGSSIVPLLLRTNKPMRIDFLSIFLEDFRGPRKTVYVLKSRARKVEVIMARGGPNLQTSRVLFSFLKQTNYFFGT